MGAFGERLRREREMRGITLDEISESTKISRRHLESLERENFDSLPGGVFNKGFVRAYARFLGIDEDQAVADYSAVTVEQAPVPDQFPLEVHDKPNRELNPRRSPLLPLIVAVAVLAALLALLLARNRGRRAETAGPRPSASAKTAVPEPTTVVTSTAVAVPTPVATQPAAAAPTPVVTQPAMAAPPAVPGPTTIGTPPIVATPPAIATPTAAAVAASPVSEKSTLPSPPPAAATPSRKLTFKPTQDHRTFIVVVRAKEDAWIALQGDGRTVWQGVLKAHKQRAVRAAKHVLLTTGNAGGLIVTHNGRGVGAVGSESEVRTLIFNATGLVR